MNAAIVAIFFCKSCCNKSVIVRSDIPAVSWKEGDALRVCNTCHDELDSKVGEVPLVFYSLVDDDALFPKLLELSSSGRRASLVQPHVSFTPYVHQPEKPERGIGKRAVSLDEGKLPSRLGSPSSYSPCSQSASLLRWHGWTFSTKNLAVLDCEPDQDICKPRRRRRASEADGMISGSGRPRSNSENKMESLRE